MTRYQCYECKAEYGTDNMEFVCINCFSREHDNFLAAHKNNMVGANLMMELKEELAQAKAACWENQAVWVEAEERAVTAEKQRDQLKARLAGIESEYRKRFLSELWATLPLELPEYHETVGLIQDASTKALSAPEVGSETKEVKA